MSGELIFEKLLRNIRDRQPWYTARFSKVSSNSDGAYGVATISRLLKRAPSQRLYSAKETHNFKEPTYRHDSEKSARIVMVHMQWLRLVGSFKL